MHAGMRACTVRLPFADCCVRSRMCSYVEKLLLFIEIKLLDMIYLICHVFDCAVLCSGINWTKFHVCVLMGWKRD